MQQLITLYHGTIHSFDTVDITTGKPYKDFGKGFYTSCDKGHAERMALRNREIEQSRVSKTDKRSIDSLVYTFEFDLINSDNLNIRKFEIPDREWMRFVIANRSNKEQQHNFDMVIGPTANDNTLTVIGLFFAGAYGDIKSNIAIDRLIEQIMPEKLPMQYFFGSLKAANFLKLKSREKIR